MRKRLEPIISIILLALALFIIFVAISRGQSSEIVASGGQFTLEKQVVAGGGNTMSQTGFVKEGTGGQTVAGTRSIGGQFTVYSGFWTPDDFAPTAATATLSGNVRTVAGNGIRNAVVSVTFPDGSIRTTITGSLGYFSINEVPIGATYVVSVESRRFAFSNATIIVEVNDNVTDIVFVSEQKQ